MNYYHNFKSSIGNIHIVCDDKHVKVVAFDKNWPYLNKKLKDIKKQKTSIHDLVIEQLSDYIKGKRKDFHIPISVEGTDFQKKVWNALLKIPYGETRTYLEQAKIIDNMKAVRAVGMANGRNPISIIVPCHRVIGKSGKLTGYAGGLDIKQKLLHLETNVLL
jgi:methylated-DNA-[protein]-cysteine S-methyltransferase